MIGIAILGAGIFAREEHLPAIKKCPLFELKAIYSRSQKSADALASEAGNGVQTYFDHPEGEAGRSLSDLLARDDVQAVVVCVPILQVPAFVRKALAAGKHVLSEKPVAPDVAQARELIGHYAELPSVQRPLWGVGENYRFADGPVTASEKVRELGGELVSFSLNLAMLLPPGYNYLETEWRKNPQHQGGMTLDAGIHFVAILRLILSPTGEDIAQVSAFTAQLQKHMPPVDTVHAILGTGNGAHGTFYLSWGAEFANKYEIEVVTTNGSVTYSPAGIKVVKKSAEGPNAEETFPAVMGSGVEAEIHAFGNGIANGALDRRHSPEEALRDLLVIQGMLESGKGNGAPQTL